MARSGRLFSFAAIEKSHISSHESDDASQIVRWQLSRVSRLTTIEARLKK
jgi:hypothetical protein